MLNWTKEVGPRYHPHCQISKHQWGNIRRGEGIARITFDIVATRRIHFFIEFTISLWYRFIIQSNPEVRICVYRLDHRHLEVIESAGYFWKAIF